MSRSPHFTNLPKRLLLVPILLMLGLGVLAESKPAPIPELAESIPLIGADAVHRLGITGKGVRVLVIDNFTPDGPYLPQYDIYLSHGRMVAAIILSVAPDAEIIPCWGIGANALYTPKECLELYGSDVDVVNMSYGYVSPYFTQPCKPWDFPEGSKIIELAKKGVVFIAASGNDRLVNALRAPACLPQVISVGAVYDGYILTEIFMPCSEFGEPDKITCYTNTAYFLDLLAPGSRIVLPGVTGIDYWLQSKENWMGGTSWAAPHVTGVVALMLEANPSLTPEEIRSILKSTGKAVEVNRVGAITGREYHYIFSRVDALAAVQAVMQRPEARIVLQDAWLTPTEVHTGESVSVYITLENQGEAGGSTHIAIRANDKIMIDTDEWIDAGSQITLTYTITFSEPGTYDITMDLAEGYHFIGTVTVESPKPDFILNDAWLEPTEVEVGDSVTVYLDVENRGDPGSLVVKIRDNNSLVVDEVVPFRAGERKTIRYELRMETPGEHKITLLVKEGEELIGTVRVVQAPMLSIEEAVAHHSGDPTLIEDPDILWAVEFWISGDPVPGTDGLIDDSNMLELVDRWITETPVTSLIGPAKFASSRSLPLVANGNTVEDELVKVTSDIPSEVQAGDTFEVTITVEAKTELDLVGVKDVLPSGFVVVGGDTRAFSINLKPGDTLTNRYEVQVLNDVSSGTYEITSTIRALPAGAQSKVLTLSSVVVVGGRGLSFVCNYAGPDKTLSGAELISAIQDYAAGQITGSQLIQIIQYYATGTRCDRPLASSLAKMTPDLPVEFSINRIAFSPNPVDGHGARFKVEGQGIESIQVQIFNLASRQVFDSGFVAGQELSWDLLDDQDRALANGVYLYVVTVRGFNGEVIRSEVQKLVVLR